MSTFSLQAILRPHILTLTPYSSARDEYTGTEGIFLDANENPFGSTLDGPTVGGSTLDDSAPGGSATLGSTTNEGNYNRYPDPHQSSIKQRLATIKGVRPQQIFLGNGSDEPIDLLVRATCTPGGPAGRQDSILIMPPTYGMYEVSAAINDVVVTKVPLTTDFQVDTQAVLAAIGPTTKLIWLCSPNNPSGNLLRETDIRRILEAADHSLVIVDEAYIDFAAAKSWTTELDNYPNLVVLQTFSKAWGLAGLRLGMAFASAELIAVLNKIKPPYNISAPTQTLALQALNQEAAKQAMVDQILAERQILAENLRSLPSVRVIHPSDANFLLVQFYDAKSTFEHLIEQRVIVRDRSKVKLCEGCLRITVGTRTENEQVLSVLRRMGNEPVANDLPLGNGASATKPEFWSNA